jgi:putative phosphoesterase
MRILVISDIHANWHALQAIQESYDIALFLGDLVDYGPDPIPCIDWVRNHCSHMVRGNHDHGVAQRCFFQGQQGYRFLTGITRPETCARIEESDRRFLAQMPLTKFLRIGDLRFFLVHATPRDPLDEFTTADPAIWSELTKDIFADFVLVGHTHNPFALKLNHLTVLNPGSVGLPRDSDWRASYAIIDGKNIELKRIEYDREAAIQSLQATKFPDIAKTMLQHVYRHGHLPIR